MFYFYYLSNPVPKKDAFFLYFEGVFVLVFVIFGKFF